MSKGLEPGCLAYVKSSSTNVLLHGRFVIAVRPWAAGDVFHIDGERFAEPTEHDLWFIKPAREGDTIPILCAYQNNQVFRSEGVLGVERASNLQRIGGPGLVSETDVLRERARDLLVDRVVAVTRELDRAAGRVAVRKITTSFHRGPL